MTHENIQRDLQYSDLNKYSSTFFVCFARSYATMRLESMQKQSSLIIWMTTTIHAVYLESNKTRNKNFVQCEKTFTPIWCMTLEERQLCMACLVTSIKIMLLAINHYLVFILKGSDVGNRMCNVLGIAEPPGTHARLGPWGTAW